MIRARSLQEIRERLDPRWRYASVDLCADLEASRARRRAEIREWLTSRSTLFGKRRALLTWAMLAVRDVLEADSRLPTKPAIIARKPCLISLPATQPTCDGDKAKAAARAFLTHAIESGAVRSVAALFDLVSRQGWEIPRVGDDSITVQLQSGERFRWRYDLATGQVGWVYALIAETLGANACYVGSTQYFLTRMRSHQQNCLVDLVCADRQWDRESTDLFRWARQRNSVVRVATLEAVDGRCSLTTREAAWTNAAAISSWETPGRERWATKSRRAIAVSSLSRNAPIERPRRFDDLDFFKAQPLDQVIKRAVLPERLMAAMRAR